jgi:hypothetical protein
MGGSFDLPRPCLIWLTFDSFDSNAKTAKRFSPLFLSGGSLEINSSLCHFSKLMISIILQFWLEKFFLFRFGPCVDCLLIPPTPPAESGALCG